MNADPSGSSALFIDWRKSTRSGNQGDCVEVASAAGHALVGVRDSKRPDAGELIFSTGSWGAFIAAVKAGEFDRG
ncbi:DUF397 domain-containing protein [Luedemannella flava]|uniref:DUF397 domain-containing protein n=1 Tax=Luedemannella flava TaxID=349316 RepID=A0ABP4XUS2_9ACTN